MLVHFFTPICSSGKFVNTIGCLLSSKDKSNALCITYIDLGATKNQENLWVNLSILPVVLRT
ncbi:hypothetical protein MADA3029_740137 [Vibrio nigripulchritudo MADA3029]|nr:hypothetical protein MADA3029_740137 [Vibrio nigripulchritudo MADA3029]